MKVLDKIHILILELIVLKNKYRNLYYKQLIKNKELEEQIKYLEMLQENNTTNKYILE
jgi:hypothetical protein